jgi:flagellar basal-body rod modification protein FlgD
MTSPISATGGAGSTTGATGSTTTGSSISRAGSTDLNQDTFLKLLVAQLKYQDPSKPMDASQFMAQTAQFTQLQTLRDVATVEQQLLAAQLVQNASTMVGRTITYKASDGATVTGLVTSATLTGSSPTVRVGDTDVALSSVITVENNAR